MTMVAKVDGEWTDVPDDDEKVLDRYSEAIPMVYAPQYFGAPPEFSWLPLYDEDGRGAFEERPEEPELEPLEASAERAARAMKRRRLHNGPMPECLNGLVMDAARGFFENEYVCIGSAHDWFEDECGENCREMATDWVRDELAKLQKQIATIAELVIKEMAAVPHA